MAKRQNKESPEKQFEMFLRKVEDLEAAGELNPTEADERFERAIKTILPANGSNSDTTQEAD